MKLSKDLYKLYLLMRFRDRDFAEIYPLIRHLLKNNHDKIYHIVDNNWYVFENPTYDDGYIFDDGIHKVFAARRTLCEKILLPFESGAVYDCQTFYDIQVTVPRGKLFPNDKTSSVFTATYARCNMPRKIFRYMRRHVPTQNIIQDVVCNHIRH